MLSIKWNVVAMVDMSHKMIVIDPFNVHVHTPAGLDTIKDSWCVYTHSNDDNDLPMSIGYEEGIPVVNSFVWNGLDFKPRMEKRKKVPPSSRTVNVLATSDYGEGSYHLDDTEITIRDVHCNPMIPPEPAAACMGFSKSGMLVIAGRDNLMLWNGREWLVEPHHQIIPVLTSKHEPHTHAVKVDSQEIMPFHNSRIGIPWYTEGKALAVEMLLCARLPAEIGSVLLKHFHSTLIA
jgi:hypothetical protein